MLDYVKTHDGQYIRVDRVGVGKTLVVMVHGLGGGSHMWLPFTIGKRKDFTFIMMNLRGFGKSESVPPHNRRDIFSDFAKDLNSVIEHYRNNKKVILCGVSAGALTSMRYLQLFGTAAVERYLNIDQSPKNMNSADWTFGIGGERYFPMFEDIGEKINTLDQYINKPLCAIDAHKRTEFENSITNFFATAFHRRLEKAIVRNAFQIPLIGTLAKKLTQVHKWETYCACVISYRSNNYDFRAMMDTIDIPVTLFVGKFSELYPPEGQWRMAEYNAKTKIVNFNESHALMWTAPLNFNREFTQFLISR